jgi:hypothetical protein
MGSGYPDNVATSELTSKLRATDGYDVESPQGHIGSVEEVWLDETNEPRALAVRTSDGRHGLLMDDQVLAVDPENRWVVVPADPTLLELDLPRLVSDGPSEPVATWVTTGERFRASTPHPHAHPALRRALRRLRAERPFWQVIAIFLASIALIVTFTITVAFLAARVVTGDAY